jgi:hypothetical protein
MRSLDILGMVVSPRPFHSSRINVIGYDVAVIGECHLTDGTLPVLFDDFAAEQLPHLGFSSGVPGISWGDAGPRSAAPQDV